MTEKAPARPDGDRFDECLSCGDVWPADGVEFPPAVCPSCGGESFDRREHPNEVLRRFVLRGRECLVVMHYAGHYCGYVRFDQTDREHGISLEQDRLHADPGVLNGPDPKTTTYVPHGGISYVSETAIGFDTNHPGDLNTFEGDPWGMAGRINHDLRRDLRENDAANVTEWTADRVEAELRDLAVRLPHREPQTDIADPALPPREQEDADTDRLSDA